MHPNGVRVAVIGLGAIGSMTLWRLASRGVDVTGFEQSVPGHDDAAYGGRTRQLRLAGGDRFARQRIALATESLQLWRELESQSNRELYVRTGQLAVGPATDPDISSLAARLDEEAVDHRILTPDQVQSRYPAHVVQDDEIGVLASEAGVLRSNVAVRCAVDAAERIGATVHRDCRVTDVSSAGHLVHVRAGRSSLSFDHVVVTAGPWVGELLPQMRDLVTVRNIVTTWFRPQDSASYAPSVFPPGVRRSSQAHSYTFLPALDEDAAKFVYWIPKRPVVSDPRHWDGRADPETVEAVSKAVGTTLRGLDRSPMKVQSYLEGFTNDRQAVIGTPHDGITVLTGFSGTGFAIAPAMGEVAADLATAGTTKRDITHLEPTRAGLSH